MSICNKYLPILLSQTLILNQTDTFALSSLPCDTIQNMKKLIFEKDYPKVFNNLPNDIHSEKSFLTFKGKPETIPGLKCVGK